MVTNKDISPVWKVQVQIQTKDNASKEPSVVYPDSDMYLQFMTKRQLVCTFGKAVNVLW